LRAEMRASVQTNNAAATGFARKLTGASQC